MSFIALPHASLCMSCNMLSAAFSSTPIPCMLDRTQRTPPSPHHAQVQAVHWAAFYEHRLQEGSKAIFHLEAFVAKFMSIYKTWTISMME